MFNWLKNLFSESSEVSAMRVMAVISLFAAIGISSLGMLLGVNPWGVAAIAGVFVGAAFGGKAYQKSKES